MTRTVVPADVMPDWPEVTSPEYGKILISGRYRSPTFVKQWMGVCGAIAFCGAIPVGIMFGSEAWYIGIGLFLVFMLIVYYFCQYRLFRSRLDIEVSEGRVRIGSELYDINSIVSIEWGVHERADDQTIVVEWRRFFSRCHQIMMLYGTRVIEVAAIFNDKKKAESLHLVLQEAIGAIGRGAVAGQSAEARTERPLPR